MHRSGDEARRVVVHRIGDALREARREFLHLVLDALLQFERVRARHLENGEHHRRVLAEESRRRILQRAEFDTRHVLQPQRGTRCRIGAHDDLAELFRVAQAADGVDLHFEGRAGGRGRLPDLAGGDLDVLFLDRVLYIDSGDAEIGELVRIEPYPHRITPLAEDLDVSNARQPLQRINDSEIGVIRQRHRIDGVVGRRQIDDQDEVRVLLLDRDAALVDDRRQRRGGLGHPVLDIDRRDIERITDIEGDRDGGGPVIRARRRHVGHAGHAVDLLFQWRRDRIRDNLGAGAWIVRRHHDLWRSNVGKLRDGKQEIADRPGEHHDDRDRRGEDRSMDEKIDHAKALSSATKPGLRRQTGAAGIQSV